MTFLWKFLNSPLVVVLIALAIWPLLSAMSAQYAWRNVAGAIAGDVTSAYSGLKNTQMKNDQAKMAALDALRIAGAKLVPAAYKGRQKVIGTLHNTGKRTVKQVKVTLSFFAGDGTFWTDLSRFEELGAAKLLKPPAAQQPQQRGRQAHPGAPGRID